MDHLTARILDQAEADGRFEQADTEFLEIWIYQNEPPQIKPLRSLIGKDREGQKFDHLGQWLDSYPGGNHPSPLKGAQPIGGLQLLIQQSRAAHVTGVTDKIPWENKEIFKAVFKTMQLPFMYVPLLQYCSGIVQLFVSPKTTGCAARLEFISHSSNYQSETWSLALSYNPETGFTTGLFSADAGMKSGAILDHLKASASMAHHPMLLPLILFRALIESSIEHRGKLHRDVYAVEKELGYLDSWNHAGEELGDSHVPAPFSYPLYDTKGPTDLKNRDTEKGIREQPRQADESKHTAEYFQDISRRLNTCRKQIAARHSRQWFWKRYRDVLIEAFDAIEQIVPGERIQQLEDAQFELRYWTSIEGALFESLDGRDMHYSARIETQLSVLYSLITQRDSRNQASIAEAAKKDGTDMKFFAYLGSFFLPANFIATIFSIEKFQFVRDPAGLFGVFVGIAFPLTMICLASYWFRPAVWRIRVENGRGRGGLERNGSGGTSSVPDWVGRVNGSISIS